MRHYGNTSMRNVFPNLPEPCRDQLRAVQESGWSCSFYLGVIDGSMAFGVTAQKGERQRIACSANVTRAIERLRREVNDTNHGIG